MEIIVLVKAIEKTLELNEPDLTALELAVRIKEKAGGRVTVMGFTGSEDTVYLYRGLYARGADRVVVYLTESLKGTSLLASASLFSRIIRERGFPEYVLMGDRSSDTAGGVMAQVLAGVLGKPVVAYVKSIENIDSNGTLKVGVTHGRNLVLSISPPAVISVTREALKPRTPTLQDKLRTRSMRVEKMIPEFPVSFPTGLSLKSLSKPPEPSRKRMILGGVDALDKLVEIIDSYTG